MRRFAKYIPSEAIKKKRPLREIKAFYPSGAIKHHYFLRGNKVEGEWVQYFENGQIYRKRNSYTGEEIDYYNNPTNTIKSTMFCDESGEEIGETKVFFDDGSLARELLVVDGICEKEVEYNPNGEKRRQHFNFNGQPCTEAEYEDHASDRLASKFVW